MSLFWFVFPLLVFSFSYFGDESKSKNKEVSKYSRVFLWLTLSIVLATCGSVFTDHANYAKFFYRFSGTEGVEFSNIEDFYIGKVEGIGSPIENGFAFLTWIIGKLGFTHIGYFFIIGAITNIFIIKALYRFRYPSIVFLTYIISVQYQQEFNLVRQMLAVSIIFYSLKFIEERDWIKFFLIAIVSFLIHQSSIISLLFLPVCFIKDYDKAWLVIKRVLLVIYIFSFLVAIKSITFNLTMVTLYFNLYADYISDEDTIGIGSQTIKLLYNLVVFLTLLLYRKMDKKLIYIIFMVFGCVIYNLSVQTPNLNRLALYFSMAYLPLVPQLLGDGYLFENKRVSSLCLKLFVIFNCSVIFYYFLTGANIIGSMFENIFNLFV